jgi:transcription initiation factor TFIIB
MISTTCRDCKNTEDFIVDIQEGTVVCRKCGLVAASRIIDDTPEWRNFSKEAAGEGADDPKRVGGANNTLLEGQGLNTMISPAGTDTSLARWNMRVSNDGIDRALSRGFSTIKEVCHHLNLNDEVEETAKIIFKLVEQSKKLKGRHHDAVVSAVVFVACRKCNQSRSLQEVSDVLNCDLRAVSKCYGLVRKEVPQTSNVKSPVQYAIRFATKVAFSIELKNQVETVAGKLVDEGILAGKNPKSIAGAAVYFVGMMNPRFRVTFGEVSEVSRMAEATIKSAFREIEQYTGELRRLLGLV